MRWAVVFRRIALAARGPGADAIAQDAQFAAEPRNVFHHFEHRLVLFGDVALQIRDLLFETFNFLAQLSGSGRGIALIFSSSGTTTR